MSPAVARPGGAFRGHARSSAFLALALIAAALAPGRSQAQTSATPAPAPPPLGAAPSTPMAPQGGAIDPQGYRLGPGDVLVVYIWGPISQTLPLEIGPEGKAFLPNSGPLRLEGLTFADARRRIEDLVRAQYRSVRVEVGIQRLRSFTVYLAGELRFRGPVIASGRNRVADVLPDTLFLNGASRRNIRLRHRDGRVSLVDVERFRLTGVDRPVSWLEDGDVIEVGHARSWLGIWGGVARPDRYELGPGDSLSTLLELGGGLLPGTLTDRALFVRWRSSGERESLWISPPDIESGAYDPPLQDGDNLYLVVDPEYRQTKQVSVVGHVMRAGDQPIRLGATRLSDAIREAGGFRPDADLSAVRLLRLRPQVVQEDPEFARLARLSREEMTDSEYESFRTRLAELSPDIRVDWRRLEKGGPALDPLLADGDVIRVDRIVRSVRVDGQVKRPGVFEFRAGESASYYIRMAGGFTARGARSQVRVTRAVNRQTVRAAGLDSVEPGDFVWVPERPDVSLWEQTRGVLAIAASVATIVIAVNSVKK